MPGRFIDGAQDPLFGNRGQVAVFQGDAVKACLPVAQHIAELGLHRAGQVLAHQIAQVALPCHKADQWNRSVGVGGLHQLHQLGALAADKAHISGMAGQPQDQFVQEQNDSVVTQCLGMPGHDAQTVVQRNIRFAITCQRAVGREKLADQIAHQACALLAIGCFQGGSAEAGGVPTGVHIAPFTARASGATGAFVELGKKGRIAHLLAHALGIRKQAFGQVETGNRRLWMALAHKLGVLPQDGALHVLGANHVVGHQQELLAMRPAVFGNHCGQFRRGAGLRVACQQEIEHRHKVALARAKTAVQVSRLAAAGLDRLLDEAQRIVKSVHQLGRDHVVAQRGVGVGYAL